MLHIVTYDSPQSHTTRQTTQERHRRAQRSLTLSAWLAALEGLSSFFEERYLNPNTSERRNARHAN